MKLGRTNWNDSVLQFITVKLERPQILAELIRRQQDCAHKKQTEHKIEALRRKYQQLSTKFRTQQNQYQFKIQWKKQIQKEVIKLSTHIKKIEVDLERISQEPIAMPYRQSGKSGKDYKEQPTRYSINSDEGAIKKHQEELTTIIADQNSLREGLKDEIGRMVARRVQLMEQLQYSTTTLRKMIQKKDLRDKVIQMDTQLEGVRTTIEGEQAKRKKLLYRLSEVSEEYEQLRENRKSMEVNWSKSSKKLNNFSKECKKVLMNEENRNTKKYKEFIKKYKVQNQIQESNFRRSFGNSPERLSSGSLSPEKKHEQFEELATQLIKKFSNKSFTQEEYSNLQSNCLRIDMYHSKLLDDDVKLAEQIVSLKQNLGRKSRELQQVKKDPMFKNKK